MDRSQTERKQWPGDFFPIGNYFAVAHLNNNEDADGPRDYTVNYARDHRRLLHIIISCYIIVQ